MVLNFENVKIIGIYILAKYFVAVKSKQTNGRRTKIQLLKYNSIQVELRSDLQQQRQRRLHTGITITNSLLIRLQQVAWARYRMDLYVATSTVFLMPRECEWSESPVILSNQLFLCFCSLWYDSALNAVVPFFSHSCYLPRRPNARINSTLHDEIWTLLQSRVSYACSKCLLFCS